MPAGVTVCNAGDAYSPAVAMHAVALLLALQRRFPVTQANQMKREWNRAVSTQLTSPAGATVAILGFGSIGQEIARLMRAFGARVVSLTRSAAPHPMADEALPIGQLHAVLPRADAVVIAMPLDASTRQLIGAKELALFRKTAVLVNISRGGDRRYGGTGRCAAQRGNRGRGARRDRSRAAARRRTRCGSRPTSSFRRTWLVPWARPGFDRLADIAAKNVERFLAGEPLAHTISL